MRVTVRYLGGEELHCDVVLNLSEGGLFLRAERVLPLGMDVDLQVAIGEGEPPIHVRGQVAWTREDGMGVRFLGLMGPRLRALLEQAQIDEEPSPGGVPE